ncbi:MAG: hypothetical protein ACR2PR_08100 [Pseudohongiellaceae bacterium]
MRTVAVDPWQEATFLEELEADGFECVAHPPTEGVDKPQVVIQVKCDRESQMVDALRRASVKCRNERKRR